jgi:hypothetical protein
MNVHTARGLVAISLDSKTVRLRVAGTAFCRVPWMTEMYCGRGFEAVLWITAIFSEIVII